jgi:outer membrane protein assembly factor BamB
LFVIAVLSLSLIGEICGCGGGGGSDAPQGPLLAWPRTRRSEINTATALAGVGTNSGAAQLHYAYLDETPSHSTPIIGREDTVYLATDERLLSIDSDPSAGVRWEMDECAPTGDPGTHRMTFLSSPTIGPDGRDIVVGSSDPANGDGGRIFWLRESTDGDSVPECMFAFPAGSRSAALTAFDGADLQLLSITTGTTSGRLISITRSGMRRWSFPEQQPFPGDLSSAPSLAEGAAIITAPDGRLHSVDQSGRSRWSARIGGAYPPDEGIPSPVAFGGIFTVSSEGELVAFSSAGTRLWTFAADEGARISGSVAVAPLTSEGGLFIGENVVFALDQQGTLYGIGTSTGELLRFCETENRACLPSSCPDEAPCDKHCSVTTDETCESDADCPEGESCSEEFRCSNAPEQECTPDLCLSNNTSGLCRREAKHVITYEPAEFRTSPVLSSDAFIVAATTDGRVCARHLDGSVPAGTCPSSGSRCTPDSCRENDCCGLDDPDCATPGRCKSEPDRACTVDTCDGETCASAWDVGSGCIALGADIGTATLSSPSIDSGGAILVTTEKGLARVQ